VRLSDEVRAHCAQVMARARHVRVRTEALEAYAAGLPERPAYPAPMVDLPDADEETRAGLVLVLDAVNFGSGWFPTLRKRDGMSGSLTVMHGIRDAFPWTVDDVAAMTPERVADATGQDPAHELMGLYAAALRELGTRAADSFLALARTPDLARELSGWPTFADPGFWKRAQITAYDVACAGLIPQGAEGDLTMFADNLVPHVLRLDGVLEYDPALLARIEAGELLRHGSPEEVEIRAGGLHAVASLARLRADLTEPSIDNLLWTRGQEPRYKAVPRHRARCTAY
jgi:hypothetical protein